MSSKDHQSRAGRAVGTPDPGEATPDAGVAATAAGAAAPETGPVEPDAGLQSEAATEGTPQTDRDDRVGASKRRALETGDSRGP
jgi:hypothetical protein